MNEYTVEKKYIEHMQKIGWKFIYKSTENPIRRNNNIPCYVVGWG